RRSAETYNSLDEWKYLGRMNGLSGITNRNVTLKIVGQNKIQNVQVSEYKLMTETIFVHSIIYPCFLICTLFKMMICN
ncbi:MAG TPA: hypothetical protein VKA92_12500, partial [Segetibacter sp.]|nr:hypothetical protein [Segetibacter sp.]